MPEALPIGGERDEEESRVHSDIEPSVVKVLDACVKEIGRRQVVAVVAGSPFVDSEDAVNERGAVESNSRQQHQRSC